MPISALNFKNKIIGKIGKKFCVKEDKKRHHVYYEIWHSNEKILRTRCSHGSSGKDIDDNILGNIKRQLALNNKKQLDQLKDCPMSAVDYFNLLKQKNVISD